MELSLTKKITRLQALSNSFYLSLSNSLVTTLQVTTHNSQRPVPLGTRYVSVLTLDPQLIKETPLPSVLQNDRSKPSAGVSVGTFVGDQDGWFRSDDGFGVVLLVLVLVCCDSSCSSYSSTTSMTRQ